MPLPSAIVLDRELCSRSLREFVSLAWAQVEPSRPFMPNWHIDAICDHLEAVACRDIRRLVINVPPGSMKSLLCGVFWPAWVWTMAPESKWITASYSGVVARRDSYRAQLLMETPWYQERWGHVWRPRSDNWSATNYGNNHSGFRLAVTVGGGVTGEHADHQMVDDPIKPLEASGSVVSSAAIRACVEWWDQTMTTRVVDPQTSTRTIIMQRLHASDLSGHVLASGDYVHLCLPMRYEPRCTITVPHPCSMGEDARGIPTATTFAGFKDPRKPGDLLWPERFPEAVQPARKKEMGAYGVAAQDQQRPAPSEGSIIKREWLRRYDALPPRLDLMWQSWDLNFDKSSTGSYVVGQVWGRKGANHYLIHQFRERVDFVASIKAVIRVSNEYPEALLKRVENKANGAALMSVLRETVPGLVPINPSGDKETRLRAVAPLFEAGNVWLPKADSAGWVDDYVDELVTFPRAANDDQCDATSQGLMQARKEIGTLAAPDMAAGYSPRNMP